MKRRSFLKCSGRAALALAAARAAPRAWGAGNAEIDYGRSRYVDSWLRHPVYGDPSFDAFERMPGNPILTGASPFAWPVNGFFFCDPVTTHWYLYVGDYPKGYKGPPPSRCILYRSMDRGKTWESLGTVLHGDPALFDKGGSTPDVSVVFEDSRYHMVYDWGRLNFGKDGGLAYARADKPEGPWHRDTQPITQNSKLAPLLGRYQRTYAGTLIRRKYDWLILAMMDHAPYSWALFAMTAPTPQGPYSERKLIRHVEAGYFHPPLMEFYPAFADAGWVYAPATSVARNRDFQMIFRAPLERADDSDAWKIVRHGSVWHSEAVPNEAYGIWGQTFSGWVGSNGRLWAMFPSRDLQGDGTINLASRSWTEPLRARGFHLSGHHAPSLTLLRRSYSDFMLNAELAALGEARIIWSYQAPLGPNRPTSNSTLHPLSLTRHQGLEMTPKGWKIIEVDRHGKVSIVTSGLQPAKRQTKISIHRRAEGTTTLQLDGKEVWSGTLAAGSGAIGLLAKAHSYIAVSRFAVTGSPKPATLSFLYTEGWLGAGENPNHWAQQEDPSFRFGIGAVCRDMNGRAKWNFIGAGFTLWSPKGPDYGTVEVLLDGAPVATVNLNLPQLKRSQPVFLKSGLSDTFHAVTLRPKTGPLVVDSLDVHG